MLLFAVGLFYSLLFQKHDYGYAIVNQVPKMTSKTSAKGRMHFSRPNTFS